MSEPDLSTPADRVRYLFKLSGMRRESHFSSLADLASSALSSMGKELSTLTVRKVAAITGASAGWIAAAEGDPPTEKRVKRKIADAQEARDARKGAAA